MRFFTTSVILAFAASVFGQTADFDPIRRPDMNEKVPAGKPFDITWEAPAKYATGNVKLHLIGGPTQATLVKISDIASGIPNSALKYTWNVDSTLGAATIYGIVITYEPDTSVFQFSNPFSITPVEGGAANTTVTVTSASGVKTVTMSSVEKSTTTSAPSSLSNLTTTSSPSRTTVTTVVNGGGSGSGGSASTTLRTTTAPAAGAQATAGSLALFGAVAFAALVL